MVNKRLIILISAKIEIKIKKSYFKLMRKTKIICTIGPSSENEETLTKMAKAGMNVARLNFSHGSHEEHQRKIDLIKKVREKLNLPIAIMLDTKGPEYRIGVFKDHKAEVKSGDYFSFSIDDVVGDNTIVSVSYKNLVNELSVGQTILVNNGLLAFEVVEKKERSVLCKVIEGGIISDKKSMNFPGHVSRAVYLSEEDKSDILFGLKNGIDFIALSFVSNQNDVKSVRTFIDKNGGEDVEIIAKIENQSGIDNIESISKYVDGIMVARGDLGVEVPFVNIPSIQKYLISKCRVIGKRVITATEMLESMINNPRPTRAEISDVANAVYDGTSAVMLSGETAAGKHPVEAVKAMASICETTENDINYEKRFRTTEYQIHSLTDAVSHATCDLAIDTKAKAIVVCSKSGHSVRLVSRFRSPIPIIGMTTNERSWRKIALSWGVTPVLSEKYNSSDVMFHYGIMRAKELFSLDKGDSVVLCGGPADGKKGTINTIKLETIN